MGRWATGPTVGASYYLPLSTGCPPFGRPFFSSLRERDSGSGVGVCDRPRRFDPPLRLRGRRTPQRVDHRPRVVPTRSEVPGESAVTIPNWLRPRRHDSRATTHESRPTIHDPRSPSAGPRRRIAADRGEVRRHHRTARRRRARGVSRSRRCRRRRWRRPIAARDRFCATAIFRSVCPRPRCSKSVRSSGCSRSTFSSNDRSASEGTTSTARPPSREALAPSPCVHRTGIPSPRG